MKKLIFLLVIIVLLAACQPAPKFPYGTIISEGPAYKQTFNTDGNVIFESQDGTDKGTYTIQGDQLTFLSGGYCDAMNAGKGVYTWTRKDDTITFKVVQDACSMRTTTLTIFAWHVQK